MKISTGTATAVGLLLIGFTIGVSIGKSSGFNTGSEWALKQADILAREAGVFMPVTFDDGNFKVIMRQPRGIYKRAWQLSDRHFERKTVKETVDTDVGGPDGSLTESNGNTPGDANF